MSSDPRREMSREMQIPRGRSTHRRVRATGGTSEARIHMFTRRAEATARRRIGHVQAPNGDGGAAASPLAGA
jgi:hypothetical protein